MKQANNKIAKAIRTIAVSAIAFILGIFNANAQVSVTSTNGYKVSIVVTPVSIVPTSKDCKYGYNYNVKLDYRVDIEGKNKPENLYTLQGYIGCGKSSHFFSLPKKAADGSTTSRSNVWNPNSDCAYSSIASLQCDSVRIIIEGPGIPQQTLRFSAGILALPVELIAFKAESKQNKVHITWQTASETNNHHYTVQRSVNGNDWYNVAEVAADATATNGRNYSSTDENPVAGTAYYRLTQTDNNGNTQVLGIQVVKTEITETLSVYPNPNTGSTIRINGLSGAENFQAELLDASGNKVVTVQLDANASADFGQLKGGLYILTVRNSSTGEIISQQRYIQL